MKKQFFFLQRALQVTRFSRFAWLALLFTGWQARSQPPAKGLIDSARVPAPSFHYLPEYTFDSPSDPGRWDKESPGLHAAVGTTDRAYFRTEVPDGSLLKNEWQARGWKGERLNAMILAWSPDSISQVRVELNDLRNERGNLLKKSNLQVQLVRYVLSNYPYNAGEVTCGVGPVDSTYLLPDRLEEFDRFDLPGRTLRPVWLSVNIPAGAETGTYKGIMEVKSETKTISLALTLRVQPQSLPAPRDWSFRLDLWQNPWVIAEYYKVKPWGREHLALLKQHLQRYADAGGKYITTYAVYSPWADNSYMTEGSMIEWTRRKDGSWVFDYSRFDRYVQLAMEAGITRAITIYTPIPWGERFRYMDEATGNYVTERWLPASPEFRQHWHAFLTDLEKHLKQKNWFHKTFLGINENAMEQTLAAIQVLKDHSRHWKITYAGDWHPELDSLLDDYSCVLGKEPSMNQVIQRKAKKQTSSFYVCCTPAKPNNFVFSPPVEGRWLGWYTQARGYDGFLRWAYDAWPADPVRDARHVLWPAGDCFLVYPGAASSIRMEKLREGIVDFEKIRILRTKAARTTDPAVRKWMQELDAHLLQLAGEKEFNEAKLEKDIRRGEQLLASLSERLGR